MNVAVRRKPLPFSIQSLMKPPHLGMLVAAALGLLAGTPAAWGKTLRIVSYNIDCADQGSDNNISGTTHSLPTVVQAIGLHHLGTNSQPMDVMSCE